MSENFQFVTIVGLSLFLGVGCSNNSPDSTSKPSTAQATDATKNLPKTQNRPTRKAKTQPSGRSRATATKYPKNTLADQNSGIEVEIGQIVDWGSFENGQPTYGPSVQLNFSGPMTKNAIRVRAVVEDVRDEFGNVMVKQEDFMVMPGQENAFRELKKPFGISLGGEKKDQFEAGNFRFRLANGVTQIKSFTGKIELLSPTKDPTSVVMASFTNDTEGPLENNVIRESGATIRLKKPELNKTTTFEILEQKMTAYTFVYALTDPKQKIAAVEVVDGDGKPFGVLSTMSMGTSPAEISLTVQSPNKPETASLKIYVATDKSVINIPFEFKNIQLDN